MVEIFLPDGQNLEAIWLDLLVFASEKRMCCVKFDRRRWRSLKPAVPKLLTNIKF
jgi:hypothetical protein